jgi:hypothetical protein
VSDGVDKVARIYGFGKKVDGAEPQGRDGFGRSGVPGDQDHRQIAIRRDGVIDLADHGQPVHFRHPQVGNDDGDVRVVQNHFQRRMAP